MKVIMYMAVSIDGFIATSGGDSEWVSEVDVKMFNQKIKDFGCIIIGGKTFRQYKDEYFPKKGVLNIVVTKDKETSSYNNVVYAGSPDEVLKIAAKKGFDKVLLIGGGAVNGSFLKESLIDEMYLDVHPVIVGSGIRLFENYERFLDVNLLDSKKLDQGQILLHYKVNK